MQFFAHTCSDEGDDSPVVIHRFCSHTIRVHNLPHESNKVLTDRVNIKSQYYRQSMIKRSFEAFTDVKRMFKSSICGIPVPRETLYLRCKQPTRFKTSFTRSRYSKR